MIKLGPNKLLVQSTAELPDPSRIEDAFVDFETTSFNPKEPALRPYLGHRIAGIAITWDENPDAYYVPIRHQGSIPNVDLGRALEWLADVLRLSKRWLNHNVKFDAHFAAVDGVEFDCELVDTLTLSKTLDSDRWSHELKPLCRDWCDLPMSGEEKLLSWLRAAKTKDYGEVPADICGNYACEDVLGNRELWRYLQAHRPSQLERVWNMETRLTPVFFDMERRGLKVDVTQLKIQTLLAARRLLEIQDRIREITGQEYVNSNKGKFELLVNQYGLPIVARTKKNEDTGGGGNASFDKDALKVYGGLPEVVTSPEVSELVELMLEYSSESTFKSLFCDSWPSKMTPEGVLHPSYKQLIRTARTSCSDPNSQQFNVRAKQLIVADDGRVLLVGDASQIEFRGIIHYIEDEEAIAAYAENPDLDFHMWVAGICHMERDPAKTVNFSIGYGAGKKNVTGQLARDKSVMAEVQEQVKQEIEAGVTMHADRATRYRELCERRAVTIYETYHERLPGIRKMSRLAANTAEKRGFVFNAFGRRRHIPPDRARIAFNSIVQSWAGDIIKERMIALSSRYNKKMRDADSHLILNVHDELGFDCPQEVGEDPEFQQYVKDTLCETELEFRVPIRWKVGVSRKCWAEAKA